MIFFNGIMNRAYPHVKRLYEAITYMITHDPMSAGINVLRVMMPIAAIIFVVTLVISLQPIKLPTAGAEHIAAVEDIAPHTKQYALSFYLDPIQNNKLFKISEEIHEPTVALSASKKPEAPPVSINDLTKDLVLVGILTANGIQAVIEDRSQQKTTYLKKGDTINGVMVDDILENKVILKYNNETKELFL